MYQPPLFQMYPQLKDRIPFVHMGTYPTRVHRLEKLGEHLGCSSLWIKRDDESSDIYGGNKVRMMEFVLADAKKKNRCALVCWGALGSNQILATCVWGRHLGFTEISAVYNQQPVHDYVRRNLLIDAALGARMDCANSSTQLALKLFTQYLKYTNPLKGRRPYLVPLVGSSALSCLGYVNAAFELKQQIDEGLAPEPDVIFITVGTGGTMAGLQLGLRMAGLQSTLMGVRILEEQFVNERMIAWEINRTMRLLRKCGCDPGYPKYRPGDVTLVHDFIGDEYAAATEEGRHAIEIAAEKEGLLLDVTYTGKTMAALMSFVRTNDNAQKNIMFWHTFNSVDLSSFLKDAPHPTELPEQFHRYF
jgi:D-cysteine desulfhydrase